MKSNAAIVLFPYRRVVLLWALGLLMACALVHPVKSPAAADQATPALVPAPLKPDDSPRSGFLSSAIGALLVVHT